MPRFSATVMDHFQSPRNQGRLEAPNLVGVAGVPGRGPYLVLHLGLNEDRITDAGFQCHGCGATIASGSMLTELVLGRTVAEAQAFDAATVLDALDGLPADKRHCAGLAVNALRQALAEFVPSDSATEPDQ